METVVYLNDFLYILPELYVFAIISLLLILSTYCTKIFNQFFIKPTSYVFLYSQLLVILILFQSFNFNFSILNNHYVSDLLVFGGKCSFVLFLVICLYSFILYFKYEYIYLNEYIILFGFMLISSFCLLSSNDFFLFYLSLELQSLILYILATVKRFSNFSTEAGLKYFV
jgi:NADH-quinone oxidoreductase subunit N